MSGLPILVEGSALHALVVGGGTVASRKAAVLIDAGARVRIVAPVIAVAIRALADDARVDVVERRYERGDIGDAQLVVAATDDRAVNAAVAADARAAGRLVNVADVPSEGSFATMAMHRSGALVAASLGTRAPAVVPYRGVGGERDLRRAELVRQDDWCTELAECSVELKEVLAVAHRECRAVIRLVGDDARMAPVVSDCRAPQRCLFRNAEFISGPR